MNYWTNYPNLHEELLRVEEYMKKSVYSRNKELTEIALGLINSGGKRIRPAFVILSAKAGKNYNEDIIIPLAASVELIHMATLVHDDIIDEAKYRRGMSSVHHKWGQDMAIYVGDYLLTKAFLILSEKTSFKHLNYVAKIIKAICEGEINQYQNKYILKNRFDYMKNIYRKTSILFAMSLGIGAYESKCSRNQVKALSLFGTYYGMAFQIYDDLLDYTSTTEIIGKPVGNDLKQGYYTLPLINALEDRVYGPLINNLLEQRDDITDEQINEIFNLVKKTKGIDESRILLDKLVKKAQVQLSKIRNKEVKEVLNGLLLKLKD